MPEEQFKYLKKNDDIFYPITKGSVVIFDDGSSAEVSNEEMDEIFRPNE